MKKRKTGISVVRSPIKKRKNKRISRREVELRKRIDELQEDTESREIESDIFHTMNFLRMSPIVFVRILEDRKKLFKEKNYVVPGKGTVFTKEGTEAIDEAIECMKSCKTRNEFIFSPGLTLAAKDRINQKMVNGENLSFERRMRKYGVMESRHCQAGEIVLDGLKDPQNIVLELLIDDGVKDRNNRDLFLLSEHVKYVGIAFGGWNMGSNDETKKKVVVISYCNEYCDFDMVKCFPQPKNRIDFSDYQLLDLQEMSVASISPMKLNRWVERGVAEIQNESLTIYRDAKRYGIEIYSPYSYYIFTNSAVDVVFSFKRDIPKDKIVMIVNNDKCYFPFNKLIKEKMFYFLRIVSAQKGYVGIIIGKSFVFKFKTS